MKKLNKLGFTIVELVIVIAIVSVLAAVNIPIFSGLIEKANQSVDVQLLEHMNTMLAAEGAVEKNSLFDVYEALEDMGCDPEDYQPLTKDTYFFWDMDEDRIIQIDDTKTVIAPAEYAGLTYEYDIEENGITKKVTRNWLSLTMKTMDTKAPKLENGEEYKGYANYNEDITVIVTSGEEFAYVINDLNSQAKYDKDAAGDQITLNKDITIKVAGEINMMGAGCALPVLYSNGEHYNFTIMGTTEDATIKNVSYIDPAVLGDGETEGRDGQYDMSGFIARVRSEKITVTFKDIIIENVNLKNPHVGNVGIFVGQNNGNLCLNNVVVRNSEVIAHRSVGALIGNNQNRGTLKIDNLDMVNVHVKTVGGRSAMLVGYNQNANGIEVVPPTDPDDASIMFTNCSFDIYKCEQNTGSKTIGEATRDNLGVQANGEVISWYLNGEKGEAFDDGKYFVKDALVLVSGKDSKGTAIQVSNDSLFGDVEGWN